MKRILLAIFLACFPLAAMAQVSPLLSSSGDGYAPTLLTDRKPIAVVYYDIPSLLGGATDATDFTARKLTDNQNVGSLWAELKRNGQDVHFYNASYFTGSVAADNLWRNLGTKYAVAICIGFRSVYAGHAAGATNIRKFFCPDSTTAQLIHWSWPSLLTEDAGDFTAYMYGTGVVGGSLDAEQNNGSAGAGGDATNFGFVSPSGDSMFTSTAQIAVAAYAYPHLPFTPTDIAGTLSGSTFTATSGTPFTALQAGGRAVLVSGAATVTQPCWVSATNSSTTATLAVTERVPGLGAGALADGACTIRFFAPDSTFPRVQKLVQLFRPSFNGAKFYVRGGVCAFDSANTVYADSVATYSREALPLAWRAYWEHPSTVTTPWGADTTRTHWVDYVAWQPAVGSNSIKSHYVYALVCRYAKVNTIKLAYEWDDYAPFGYDKDDSLNSVYRRRWPTPDSLKAFRTMLARYGISNFVSTGMPDSLYAYATKTFTGSQDGVSRSLTYPEIRNLAGFSAHVHDTTTAKQFGVVLGVGSEARCDTCALVFDHRVAFSDSASLGDTDYRRRGIYQRIAAFDSAFTANFGSGKVIPYLSFPNEMSAPLDIRRQYTNINRLGNGQCPPESLFKAFAYNGKRTIRGFSYLNNPNAYIPSDGTTSNAGITMASVGYADTATGRVVVRYFSNADEVYRGDGAPAKYADSQSGKYSVRCIGDYDLANISPTLMAKPWDCLRRAYGLIATSTLLGCQYRPPMAYQPQTGLGESAVGAANPALFRTSTDYGRVRMVFQHPLATQYNLTGSWQTYNSEQANARVQMLEPLKCLSGLAGHPLVQWVQPWQVWDK